VPPFVSPTVVFAAACLMAYWSWGAWPDVIVDFGRELYVAWRLSEGAVLYRDVGHVQGPLSPYLNATWFRLCGTSLHTLVFANLALLALLTVLLLRLLAAMGSRLAATVAGVVFVTLFAFAELTGIGNYNYVCPYRHETTHGLILGMLAVACLDVYVRRPSRSLLAAIGLALGLGFLGKPEMFVAAAGAVAAGLACGLWRERPSWREAGVRAAVLAAPAVVIVMAAIVVLPAGGVLGPWSAVGSAAYRGSAFYRNSMGLQAADAMKLVRASAVWVIVWGAILALALRLPKGAVRGAATVLLCLAVPLLLPLTPSFWLDVFRPLPLVVAVILMVAVARLSTRRGDGEMARRCSLIVTMAVYALLLLGKMAFNVRISQYGFVLAMPATLLLVMAVVDWIPAWVGGRGGGAWTFRAAALVLIAWGVAVPLTVFEAMFARKTHVVGTGSDSFRAGSRGPVVTEALAAIAREVRPDQTLLVLPEGLMLNYLSRRVDPSPYAELMPTEVDYYGEDRVLASFAAHPPDYVALVHKDTSEYGPRFFGRDYGQKIYTWVRAHYQEVALAGARPFEQERFGILLLKRTS
jgi:hypothetical protein